MARIYTAAEFIERGVAVFLKDGLIYPCSATDSPEGVTTKPLPKGAEVDMDQGRPMTYDEFNAL